MYATYILKIISALHMTCRNSDLFFILPFYRLILEMALPETFPEQNVRLGMVTLKQQLESTSVTSNCALAMIANAGCCFCLTFNEENKSFIFVTTFLITYLPISPALINSKCNMSARTPQWLNLFVKLRVCVRCYRTTNVQGLTLMLQSIVFIFSF